MARWLPIISSIVVALSVAVIALYFGTRKSLTPRVARHERPMLVMTDNLGPQLVVMPRASF